MREIEELEKVRVEGANSPRFETDENGITWMVTCTGDRIQVTY